MSDIWQFHRDSIDDASAESHFAEHQRKGSTLQVYDNAKGSRAMPPRDAAFDKRKDCERLRQNMM